MSLFASGHVHAAGVDRRRRFSGLLCLVLLMLFTCGVWRLTRGLTVWTFEAWRQQQIAEGSLQAQEVSVKGFTPSWPWPHTRSDANARIYLVDFIYTRCPTVCRTLGSEFQQMQSALRVSMDPSSKQVRLVASIKYLSWWLVGGLLCHSWQRMSPEVLWFFIGNLAWMSATAGMLYWDTPARLCVNYLIDDQRHTGVGLVLMSLVLGVLAWRQTCRCVSTHGAIGSA